MNIQACFTFYFFHFFFTILQLMNRKIDRKFILCLMVLVTAWLYLELEQEELEQEELEQEEIERERLEREQLEREKRERQRIAIVRNVKQSPMYKVLKNRHEGSYMVHLGLVPDAFDQLHHLFRQHYPSVERADTFTSGIILAVVLASLRSRGAPMGLLFGLKPTLMNKMQRIGSDVLRTVYAKENGRFIELMPKKSLKNLML